MKEHLPKSNLDLISILFVSLYRAVRPCFTLDAEARNAHKRKLRNFTEKVDAMNQRHRDGLEPTEDELGEFFFYMKTL